MLGDAVLFAVLFPATGAVAILFSFFMVSDPGSTPNHWKNQVLFGASVGVLYGVLTQLHVVFGLFWALVATCGMRGLLMTMTRKNLTAGDLLKMDDQGVKESHVPKELKQVS